ncbi:MAG TPA: GNAT family N-acetyltransferase [Alphaproteobacteria bacterium]|nr:GNAT family N-acetyltransferase [Alphaproteobacteria bacterium]
MPQPTPQVTLREITGQTLPEILALELGPQQDDYIATNAVSIAEAHFEPGAWFRGVYSGGAPVGFVMLFNPTIPGAMANDPIAPTDIVLWRLMIDRRHQRRGLGRATLDELRRHIPSIGDFRRLLTSYRPGPASPAGFYESYGFSETGRLWDNGTEVELALPL